MAGGCMNSYSGTGTIGLGTITTLGFGGTSLGYGMYAGNTAGYGYGGNGYNNNGYNSNAVNSNAANANAANGGNFNPFGQAVGGGPARFNAQQAPQQNAAAADPADAPPPLDLPMRNWAEEGSDVVEAQFVGLLDGKVIVRKPNKSLLQLSLDQLSDEDRQYVASVAGHKAATPAVAESE
jgi:hypothetical protein